MTLNEFWKENPKAAIAFSGGVDSSYLLYTAVKAGAKVTAYYADSAFQPAFEQEDALRLAKDVGAELKILPLSVLEVPKVAENPENRCYYCKRAIFSALIAAAAADGYDLILDGTNASDPVSDRPGNGGSAGAVRPVASAGVRPDQKRNPGIVPAGGTFYLG